MLLCTCKKYDDGPFFNLKAKIARITGLWEPEAFLVNGMDSTAILKADFCYGEYSIKVSDMGEKSVRVLSKNMPCDHRLSRWNFDDCRKVFAVNGFSTVNGTNTIYGPYGSPLSVRWEILRFTNKAFWLRTTYQGKTYEIKFKKTKEYKREFKR